MHKPNTCAKQVNGYSEINPLSKYKTLKRFRVHLNPDKTSVIYSLYLDEQLKKK